VPADPGFRQGRLLRVKAVAGPGGVARFAVRSSSAP
jgi:hypothetical protein